jgi:PKD repeat protein
MGGSAVDPDHGCRAAAMAALVVTFVLVLAGVAAAAPAVDFSSSPTSPNIGQTVSFTSVASDIPSDNVTYAWSFGDGATSTAANPTHAYASAGDKAVTVTIAAAGQTATATHAVHVNVPPTATFVFAALVQPPAGQDPLTPLIGQQVAFSAAGSSDPDGTIASYAWDLGSGTFEPPTESSYVLTTFPLAGTRTVRLQVTDDRGATGVAQVTFRVNTPPVAAFAFTPAAPAPNAMVTFTSGAGDADGDLTALKWDLNGDGRFDDASGPSATAVYLTAGDYKVGLQATDSGGASATTSRTVSVAGPAAPPMVLSGGSGDPVVVPSPGAAPLTSLPSGTPGGAPAAGAVASAAAPKLKAVPNVRVRMAGSVTGALTRITRLTVIAPPGALVVARCRGAGCPKRAVRQRVASTGRLRLSRLERRLGAGATIVVSVAQPGYATRRIVLTLRRGSAPLRSQSCVYPGQKEPGPCSA